MAYVALAVINGAMLSFLVYKIVNRKVVTFVGKISRKITRKNDQIIPLLDESFIKNEEEMYYSSRSGSTIIHKDKDNSILSVQNTSSSLQENTLANAQDKDNSKIQKDEALSSNLIL